MREENPPMKFPHSSAPSPDIKPANQPDMRFLFPLAAICAAAVLLSPSTGEAQSSAVKLRPDQERAVELALREVEPAMRPMARQQLAATFANLNEAQIAMMIARMDVSRGEAANAPAPAVEATRES